MGPALKSPQAPSMPDRVHELVARAQDAPEIADQPGRFAILTPVSAAVAVLCGAAGALGLRPAFTLTLGVLSGIIAIFSMIGDLLLPSPRDRRSAEAAARCFGTSLKRSRWKNAYACLHRDVLPDRMTIPDLPLLNVRPRETSYSTLSGFRRYWRSILRSQGATLRVCREVQLGELKVDGDYATGRMFLKIERASQWTWLGLLLGMVPAIIIYRLSMKMVELELPITLFRHKSQWWLLPPSLEGSQTRLLSG